MLEAERERLESELRESEERLRLALSSANQGLYDLNLQTGEAVVTAEYATMLGYDPATFQETNQRWFERLHPDDVARVGEVFRAYVAGELPTYSVEHRQRTRDGGWKWLLSVGKILERDAEGRPLRMLGTHTDITARKEAEHTLLELNQELERRVAERTAALRASRESLRRSEAHLLAAQRIAALGSWEYELATGTVIWSDEVYRIYGRDLALGTPSFEDVQSYIVPEDRELHAQVVARAIAEGEPYELELRLLDPDGDLRFCQARGVPVRDEHGALVRLVGTALDITGRRRIEAQLRSLADRLALAVRSAALGIWDWDIGKNVITWDQRMYELYGLTAESFGNAYEAWANGLHPDDRAEGELAIERALRGEREFDTEFRVCHPDGAVRVIKAYGLITRDPDGVPLRMIGVNFDITERRLAEDQLRATSAQLMAANGELEAFAYSVSHDLRAPLRAIDGFSQALVEDYDQLLDDGARAYVTRIRGGVRRMSQLIDDLLQLSRVSRAEMILARVDLSKLVLRIADEQREANLGRTVEVVIAPDVMAWGDANLLRVLFDNLLANAWKFTSRHTHARIEFGVTHVDGKPAYFVRDDGAGYDPAYTNKLFGVFQRLHDAHEFPGTGIGLATVQRIVHRHGGLVWSEGAVEQGATFFFTLPGGRLREERRHGQ
jgi:PAS domain S-box-containing protein